MLKGEFSIGHRSNLAMRNLSGSDGLLVKTKLAISQTSSRESFGISTCGNASCWWHEIANTEQFCLKIPCSQVLFKLDVDFLDF